MLSQCIHRLRGRRDIQVLKTYGAAPYAAGLKKLEKQIKEKQTSVNEKIGVKVGSEHNQMHIGVI